MDTLSRDAKAGANLFKGRTIGVQRVHIARTSTGDLSRGLIRIDNGAYFTNDW